MHGELLVGGIIKPEENMGVCRPTVLKFDALKVVDHYIRPEGGYPGVAEDVENDTHKSVK